MPRLRKSLPVNRLLRDEIAKIIAENRDGMMKKDKREISIVRSSAAEYLTFVASTGEDKKSIEMRYEDENIWLTQKMMASLYDVDVRTINDHIKKIYSDSELEQSATIRKYRIVPNGRFPSGCP